MRINITKFRNMSVSAGIILLLLALPAQVLAASMGDYCVMPPYVKTSVQPNIMIIMDNAKDMGDKAYKVIPPDAEDTYHTNVGYDGYFKKTLKYSYVSNRWEPDPAGIYSGNLLNWITTSKYDFLQSVLVGGISTSRQSNVNTLVSKSNAWERTLTYTDSSGRSRTCVFKVNSGNIEITETKANDCGYLDTPAYPIPVDPDPSITESSIRTDTPFAQLQPKHSAPVAAVSSDIYPSGIQKSLWSSMLRAIMDLLVPSAEAATSQPAQLRITGGPSDLPNATECTSGYYASISASGGTCTGYPNCTPNYTWSITSGSLPVGFTLSTSGTPYAYIKAGSGYPGPNTSGKYDFSVTVTDGFGGSDTKSFSITIVDAVVTITSTSPLQESYVGAYYQVPLTATSACNTSYTWSVKSGSSLPPGFSLYQWTTTDTKMYSPGALTAGDYFFYLQVRDAGGNIAEKQFELKVNPAPVGLAITSGSPLVSGTIGQPYFIYLETISGVGYSPFTWSIISGSLPPGLNFSGGSSYFTSISGTPTGTFTTPQTYTFEVSVNDSHSPKWAATKVFSITINPAPTVIRTSGNLRVNVCTGNYTYNCNTSLPSSSPPTSKDDWIAAGCSLSNTTQCILKTGFVDDYWTSARFGLMDFSAKGGNAFPERLNCIEQNPAPTPDSNFMTAIENAVGIDPTTTLVTGEHFAIDYFQTATGECDPYKNATSCTKNFILMLTSGLGADNPDHPDAGPPTLTDSTFSGSGMPAICTSDALSNLAKNACYGYNHTDLRSDWAGRQFVGTYIVNTMGTAATSGYNSSTYPVTTGDFLKQAAAKGGGSYYEAVTPQQLRDQLKQALMDIIKRAASGTAASVMASGEGSGANLIQAVYYPRKKFGDTEISWIGRLSNLWYYVDPRFTNSTIREDDGDKVLNLLTDGTHHDYITSLYFNGDVTMARRWEDTNGDGIIDGDALSPDIEFENIGNLWEAGSLLWSRDLSTSPRTIFTTIDSHTTISFSTANKTVLRDYLQAASDAESEAIIRYMHGEDTPFSPAISGFSSTYRNRTVTMNGVTHTWKLGDILNSTPRLVTWLPRNGYHKIDRDSTYGVVGEDPSLTQAADPNHFITSSSYKSRGMVVAGGNDGMLHAFKLGTLELKWSPQAATEKARLTGSDLGKEVWAFIPKNALPYLKYMTETGYCHVYSVDLTPYIFDASIGADSSVTPDTPKTPDTWRTILIGGMRYGGACKPKNSNCSIDSPNSVCAPTEVGGVSVGYSSYFALDVTDQNNPKLLWEFSDPTLGFSTSGPAVVRINATTGGVQDTTKNGHWYVVLASGPTGPIKDTQFMGNSDQPLKLFILNLKDGSVVSTINTGIANAFGGSLYNSTMDTDQDYSDDVVYIPYVQQYGPAWTSGGVLRLSTDEKTSGWTVSTVLDGAGAVTSSVVKLLNKNTGTLWIYFGTGRYYYETQTTTDDGDSRRMLVGFKEPCYSSTTGFNGSCTTMVDGSTLTNVTDITKVPTNPDDSGFKGWWIQLDPDGVPDPTLRAERVITDPLASSIGVVFFTTYKPYRDPCALGGKSYIWAIKYNSGGDPSTLLKGKALIQTSTGSIEQIDLSKAFKDRKGGEMENTPGTTQGLNIMTTPKPAKRVLHMRER